MSQENETNSKKSIFDIIRDVHGIQFTAFRAETTTKIVGIRTVNRQKPGTADQLETVKQIVEVIVDKVNKVGIAFIGGNMIANVKCNTNRMVERMCCQAVLYWLNESKRIKALHKKAKIQ